MTARLILLGEQRFGKVGHFSRVFQKMSESFNTNNTPLSSSKTKGKHWTAFGCNNSERASDRSSLLLVSQGDPPKKSEEIDGVI